MNKSLGHVGFDAFNAAHPSQYKLTWKEIPVEIRSAWEKAGEAIKTAVEKSEPVHGGNESEAKP